MILFFALVVFVIENLMIGVILDQFQLSDGAKKKIQRQKLLDGLRMKKVRLNRETSHAGHLCAIFYVSCWGSLPQAWHRPVGCEERQYSLCIQWCCWTPLINVTDQNSDFEVSKSAEGFERFEWAHLPCCCSRSLCLEICKFLSTLQESFQSPYLGQHHWHKHAFLSSWGHCGLLDTATMILDCTRIGLHDTFCKILVPHVIKLTCRQSYDQRNLYGDSRAYWPAMCPSFHCILKHTHHWQLIFFSC